MKAKLKAPSKIVTFFVLQPGSRRKCVYAVKVTLTVPCSQLNSLATLKPSFRLIDKYVGTIEVLPPNSSLAVFDELHNTSGRVFYNCAACGYDYNIHGDTCECCGSVHSHLNASVQAFQPLPPKVVKALQEIGHIFTQDPNKAMELGDTKFEKIVVPWLLERS